MRWVCWRKLAALRLAGIADLGEDLVPRRLHLVDPLVAGGQDRLGGGEVRGRGPEVGHQFLERFDLGKGFEPGPMGGHFRGVVAEILELAGRGVGLQGFEEGLGLVQFGAQPSVTSSSASRLRPQKNRPVCRLCCTSTSRSTALVTAFCSS